MDGLPAVATLLKYRLHLPEAVDISAIEKGLVVAAGSAAAAMLLLLVRLLFPRRRR
jgi:hypothetical protein